MKLTQNVLNVIIYTNVVVRMDGDGKTMKQVGERAAWGDGVAILDRRSQGRAL